MGIVTEALNYQHDGTNLCGHVAYDDTKTGPRPVVLVIHEWWGLDDYIRSRASQAAELGYCAMAIDMYGDGKTADNPTDAGALMNAVLEDMTTGTGRLKAATAAISNHTCADASRMAAIGYCFGGAMVLHMARIGMPLKAVVSFHGSLGSFHTPSPGEISAKILVCHGDADEFISQAEIDAFHAEMKAAKADYDFVAYDNALHGFSNKHADANGKKYSLPLAYDKSADEQSWQAMRALFTSTL